MKPFPRRCLLKTSVIVASLCLLTACSINVPQWEAFQQFRGASSAELEGAQWAVFWDGQATTFYAVAAENGALFVNGQGARVFFQELNISRVEGLVRGIDSLWLEFTPDGISYWSQQGLVFSARCQPWMIAVDEEANAVSYQQYCEVENTADTESQLMQKSYTNEIGLDANGEISRLLFVIHPEYAPLVMTHKQETK